MSSLSQIWTCIVQEALDSQVLDGEKRGLINNFLLDQPYYRETSAAAKIFATQYILTGERIFHERASMALRAIENIVNNSTLRNGIDEPFISPRGLRSRKGSIPATIILFEYAEEAAGLLHVQMNWDTDLFLSFIERCYLGGGRFYHDVISNCHSKYPHIINTSAMAYYFLQAINRDHDYGLIPQRVIPKTRERILSSARSDGFFPYIEPQVWQRAFFRIHRFFPLLFTKVFNRILGDHAIFFGDTLHHIVTIYYFMKASSIGDKALSNSQKRALQKSWHFIKNHLTEYKDTFIKIDFSWEPVPTCYRHANFVDTSAYFYLIDLLRYLPLHGLISRIEADYYVEGLSNHIRDRLLRPEHIPCIQAYEGRQEIIENIMPRPSESVFIKGALFSNTILERQASEGREN
ncbi:MAG: hypothetical protein JRJ31_05450 [Deltaproteobacteria bacterium]|nr:hypothetical protein [Deltaproteobacteria bacterium]